MSGIAPLLAGYQADGWGISVHSMAVRGALVYFSGLFRNYMIQAMTDYPWAHKAPPHHSCDRIRNINCCTVTLTETEEHLCRPKIVMVSMSSSVKMALRSMEDEIKVGSKTIH